MQPEHGQFGSVLSVTYMTRCYGCNSQRRGTTTVLEKEPLRLLLYFLAGPLLLNFTPYLFILPFNKF